MNPNGLNEITDKKMERHMWMENNEMWSSLKKNKNPHGDFSYFLKDKQHAKTLINLITDFFSKIFNTFDNKIKVSLYNYISLEKSHLDKNSFLNKKIKTDFIKIMEKIKTQIKFIKIGQEKKRVFLKKHSSCEKKHCRDRLITKMENQVNRFKCFNLRCSNCKKRYVFPDNLELNTSFEEVESQNFEIENNFKIINTTQTNTFSSNTRNFLKGNFRNSDVNSGSNNLNLRNPNLENKISKNGIKDCLRKSDYYEAGNFLKMKTGQSVQKIYSKCENKDDFLKDNSIRKNLFKDIYDNLEIKETIKNEVVEDLNKKKVSFIFKKEDDSQSFEKNFLRKKSELFYIPQKEKSPKKSEGAKKEKKNKYLNLFQKQINELNKKNTLLSKEKTEENNFFEFDNNIKKNEPSQLTKNNIIDQNNINLKFRNSLVLNKNQLILEDNNDFLKNKKFSCIKKENIIKTKNCFEKIELNKNNFKNPLKNKKEEHTENLKIGYSLSSSFSQKIKLDNSSQEEKKLENEKICENQNQNKINRKTSKRTKNNLKSKKFLLPPLEKQKLNDKEKKEVLKNNFTIEELDQILSPDQNRKKISSIEKEKRENKKQKKESIDLGFNIVQTKIRKKIERNVITNKQQKSDINIRSAKMLINQNYFNNDNKKKFGSRELLFPSKKNNGEELTKNSGREFDEFHFYEYDEVEDNLGNKAQEKKLQTERIFDQKYDKFENFHNKNISKNNENKKSTSRRHMTFTKGKSDFLSNPIRLKQTNKNSLFNENNGI